LSNPLPAASIILEDRYSPGSIYLVQRAKALKFLGGFHAFPGGKVDPPDAEIAQSESPWDIAVVAAIRELFEETGVLLCRDSSNNSIKSSPQLAQIRCDLLEKRSDFASIIRDNNWVLSASDLYPIGYFTTPLFSPMRFETRFFLAKIPSGQTPEVFENELENGVWGTPAEHLKKWYADDILISPPVLALLEKLNKSPASDWRLSSDKGLITQDEFVLDRVRFASWIQVVSVACPGPSLPQIGNVFLVGLSKFYLIDPGALDDLGVLAIQNAIQSRVNEGDSFYGILLTHHHPDHTNSANHFADLWDVPVLAHLATAEKLLNKIQVNQHLDDCDQIPLGFNPFTGSNLVLTAYHTPGHAPGHLVFFEAKTKTLFAGDLVSTSTTVLVSPPDGHLATYIHSINRMADFNPELLMPFHGCPSANGKGVLQTAVFHREKREAALLLALANNCHSLEALANEVYRGLPDPLMKLAQKQIHAGLIKLSEEGIVIAPLNNANEWKLAQ